MELARVDWAPGTLTSVYPNTQRAGTLWYHDHVLGMTRVDVQTGLDGFYIISGGDADVPEGQLPGPRPCRAIRRASGTTTS
jgi:spore coat protein A